MIELLIQELHDDFKNLDYTIKNNFFTEGFGTEPELDNIVKGSKYGSKYGQFAVENRSEISYLERKADELDS